MARNKYNELKKARKAKMQKLRLQHAMWGTLLVVLSLMIAYVSPVFWGKYILLATLWEVKPLSADLLQICWQ